MELVKPVYDLETNRYPTVRHKAFRAGQRLFIDVAYLSQKDDIAAPDLEQMWGIFISGMQEGSDLKQYEEDVGILLSIGLQEGKKPEKMLRTLSGGEETLAAFALRIALEGKDDNFVRTPPEPTLAFIDHPAFNMVVPDGAKMWDCCCGDGAMSKIFESAGYDVENTNLNDRGYGEPGVDFLKTTKRRADHMVINPPFDAPTGTAAQFFTPCWLFKNSIFSYVIKNIIHAGWPG